MIVIVSVNEQRDNGKCEWKSRLGHITRNARASQFLGDETTTMGMREDTPVQTMRGHPLFALTAEREKEREMREERERDRHIDVDEGERDE